MGRAAVVLQAVLLLLSSGAARWVVTPGQCSGLVVLNTSTQLWHARGPLTISDGPLNYDAEMDCTWRITVPQGRRIKLVFLEFDMENAADGVRVYDAQNDTGLANRGRLYRGNAPGVKFEQDRFDPLAGDMMFSGKIAEWEGDQLKIRPVLATGQALLSTGPDMFIRALADDALSAPGFVARIEEVPEAAPSCAGCVQRGHACGDDRECPLGSSCEAVVGARWQYDTLGRGWAVRDLAAGMKVCRESLFGADCSSNPFACTQGLACLGGRCTYPRFPGDSCSDTQACSIGRCQGERCVDLTNTTLGGGGSTISKPFPDGQCEDTACSNYSQPVRCLRPRPWFKNESCEVLPGHGERCWAALCAPDVDGAPLDCRDANVSQIHTDSLFVERNYSEYRCFRKLQHGPAFGGAKPCYTQHRHVCGGGPDGVLPTGSGLAVFSGVGACLKSATPPSALYGPDGMCTGHRSIAVGMPAARAELCESGHLERNTFNGTHVVALQPGRCAPRPRFNGNMHLESVVVRHYSNTTHFVSKTVAALVPALASCSLPTPSYKCSNNAGTYNAAAKSCNVGAVEKADNWTRVLDEDRFRSCPLHCENNADCAAAGYDTSAVTCSCTVGESRPTCKDTRNVNSVGRPLCKGCCLPELRALQACKDQLFAGTDVTWVQRMAENQLTHAYHPGVRASRCLPAAFTAVACMMDNTAEYTQCGPAGLVRSNSSGKVTMVWDGLGSSAVMRVSGGKNVLINSVIDFSKRTLVVGPDVFRALDTFFRFPPRPPIPPPPKYTLQELIMIYSGIFLAMLLCWCGFTAHPKTKVHPTCLLPHSVREVVKAKKHHMNLYAEPSDLEKIRMQIIQIVDEADMLPLRSLLMDLVRSVEHQERLEHPTAVRQTAQHAEAEQRVERQVWVDEMADRRRAGHVPGASTQEKQPEAEMPESGGSSSGVADGDGDETSPPQTRAAPGGELAESASTTPSRSAKVVPGPAPAATPTRKQRPRGNGARAVAPASAAAQGAAVGTAASAVQANAPVQQLQLPENAHVLQGAKLEELLKMIHTIQAQNEHKAGEAESSHRMSVLDAKLNAVLQLLEQLRVTVVSGEDEAAESNAGPDATNNRSFPQDRAVILYKQ